MKNHELGYKSSFAEGKGRLNLTYYHMAWEDYQLQRSIHPSRTTVSTPKRARRSSPERTNAVLAYLMLCGQPWQTVIANLGEATIDGFNVSLDYSPNENWVLGFNYENMDGRD